MEAEAGMKSIYTKMRFKLMNSGCEKQGWGMGKLHVGLGAASAGGQRAGPENLHRAKTCCSLQGLPVLMNLNNP